MIDKVLASFAYPLGFALMTLILAGIIIAFGFRKTGAATVLLIASALWAASTPAFARWAILSLESQYPSQSIESYKPADVIILLGGALSPPGQGEIYPDLGSASDRILHTFRLFKAGLAPKILICGRECLFGRARF